MGGRRLLLSPSIPKRGSQNESRIGVYVQLQSMKLVCSGFPNVAREPTFLLPRPPLLTGHGLLPWCGAVCLQGDLFACTGTSSAMQSRHAGESTDGANPAFCLPVSQTLPYALSSTPISFSLAKIMLYPLLHSSRLSSPPGTGLPFETSDISSCRIITESCLILTWSLDLVLTRRN